MELSGYHFIYADKDSIDYGLIFANVDTSEINEMSGSVKTVSVFNQKSQRLSFIADDMEDSAFSFEAEVVNDEDKAYTPEEVREINKWLFNRKGYYKLFINADEDVFGNTYTIVNGITFRFYLNCRFINPSKIESPEGVIGFKFTVECDSCYAHQESITSAFTFDTNSGNTGNNIRIYVDSDTYDYVHPQVKVTMGNSGGALKIVNNTDDAARFTAFANLAASTTLTMNGETNYISGDLYQKFNDKNFIRLLPGENKLTVYGNVSSISFSWENLRFL